MLVSVAVNHYHQALQVVHRQAALLHLLLQAVPLHLHQAARLHLLLLVALHQVEYNALSHVIKITI